MQAKLTASRLQFYMMDGHKSGINLLILHSAMIEHIFQNVKLFFWKVSKTKKSLMCDLMTLSCRTGLFFFLECNLSGLAGYFRGWQMSGRSLETWSFPANASRTAAPPAWLGPHRLADAPEQALKWDLWCCADNTLRGRDGFELWARPRASVLSSHFLAGFWVSH